MKEREREEVPVMIKERLVVIGGDAAGMSAASKVRRERPEMEIVVFERSPHTSYSACGLTYYLGKVVDDPDKLVSRSPEVFREKYGIDARTCHEVLEIDKDGSRVRVRDLRDDREFWESYDHLLIATGALPVCPDLPGGDSAGIYGLSTLESGLVLRRAVDERKPKRAVVVGGGYIGLEAAEALLMRGVEVSLVQRDPQVMTSLDPDMGALISEAMREEGVTLYLGEKLEAFESSEGWVDAVVTDRRTLPADLVVLGMGVRPNSDLAAEAGIELGARKAIRTDRRLRTIVDNIWAAGDCAETWNLVSQRPFYVALGTVANKEGAIAGTNIAGGNDAFPGVVGTAITKVCETEVARTGLKERELKELGIDYVTATIRSRTRAGYYPGAARMTVKLLAEKGSGKVLGGQIVGGAGAAKRIDTLATVLHAGMDVEQMIHLDLSYAPPFSPVWDPVQIAARKLVKKV